MTTSRTLALGLSGLLVLSAACSATSVSSTPQDQRNEGIGLGKVLFSGDSIAVGQAMPLKAALDAGGVEFQSIAAEGGGNVVGPFSDESWQKISGAIASAKASVVIQQLTTYDWGTEDEQRAGYQKLLQAVTAGGAKLVLVTAPPIRPDDFYQPHMAELDRMPAVAKSVVDTSSGQAVLLDAGAVWGESYERDKDGKADRSADGIHTCPQGAARFTRWLLAELKKLYPGFSPADPQKWANAGWSADKHFARC
ncbi:SGNH/GDSL hydrolase family protein [Umezawaea endophytica]|uniref:SGNH/GDSL hydrolase family protein n=1 Tax=Umezawaea endophytica TaxID=1654476 RepID=A0A9X2VRY1_9PSEU|nr:SGNH/GDSL hydrolase family protein [Umezawaea endophytica]MCS7480443.1 SGNH/GDSL hydrolase family protein [Umezawaea endophytica]